MPLFQGQVSPGRAAGGGVTFYTVPGVEISAIGAWVLSANILRYMPVFVKAPIAVDQLACEVTVAGAGGTTARMGIYRADANWQPLGLVLDAGTVAMDSTGIKTLSISQLLAPGRYLSALHTDSAATVRAFRGGGEFMGLLSTLGATALNAYGKVTNTYAPLVDPGVAWTATDSGATPVAHLMVYRVSQI